MAVQILKSPPAESRASAAIMRRSVVVMLFALGLFSACGKSSSLPKFAEPQGQAVDPDSLADGDRIAGSHYRIHRIV